LGVVRGAERQVGSRLKATPFPPAYLRIMQIPPPFRGLASTQQQRPAAWATTLVFNLTVIRIGHTRHLRLFPSPPPNILPSWRAQLALSKIHEYAYSTDHTQQQPPQFTRSGTQRYLCHSATSQWNHPE